MSVTHETSLRNAISDTVLSEIGINAKLTLRPAADTPIIATLGLPNPSGTVGATDLTFGAFTPDPSAVAGTCTKLWIETSGNVHQFSFLPADITISQTVFLGGETVECSSLIYQPPA